MSKNVVTLKSGSMLLKVIGTDMYRSATYDFLFLWALLRWWFTT